MTTTRITPERWRAIDAVLQRALACEPWQRDALIADACGDDDVLRGEVESLLAAHDRDDDFLEKPAAELFVGELLASEANGASNEPRPLDERLAAALAGRYVIERELGHGGMATVHLARDLRLNRRVAIKVLREELAAAVGAERFLDEIRITASLQHPHILQLFDSGGVDGVLWYVMPFVEGETLRSRLAREGRLSVDVALQLAREMADALEYAHAHGVVHRDVKPENVLLRSGHALVADFGIALALERAGGERLTRTGIALGTPQYMAPEQAAGERAIDARADVYALGAVLYEMLAGEPPFAAPSRRGVVERVMHEPAAPLTKLRGDVTPDIDNAVRRALAKRPEDRFASAVAFATALKVSPSVPTPGSGVSTKDTRADAPTAHSQTVAPPDRRVSARMAMYAAGAMLAIGLGGGLAIGNLSMLGQWVSAASDFIGQLGPWKKGAPTWGPPKNDGLVLAVVDRAGKQQRIIAANRPWTPRFSPDGNQVAYGAFGPGRSTSDIWLTDLRAGTTRRLTDDGGDSNDPQWSSDGRTVAYSWDAPGGKDMFVRPASGGDSSLLAARDRMQFATDWARNGSALLLTEQGPAGQDILVQPADGSTAWPYLATSANESAARVSPDGRWVAYTSDESGRAEVYLDSYPRPTKRVAISQGGGIHPAWRGNGRELYYWNDGALVAVKLGAPWGNEPPEVESRSVLFRAQYANLSANTMYDVSPDGQRFVIVLGGGW